jgi:hypothetical protein
MWMFYQLIVSKAHILRIFPPIYIKIEVIFHFQRVQRGWNCQSQESINPTCTVLIFLAICSTHLYSLQSPAPSSPFMYAIFIRTSHHVCTTCTMRVKTIKDIKVLIHCNTYIYNTENECIVSLRKWSLYMFYIKTLKNFDPLFFLWISVERITKLYWMS